VHGKAESHSRRWIRPNNFWTSVGIETEAPGRRRNVFVSGQHRAAQCMRYKIFELQVVEGELLESRALLVAKNRKVIAAQVRLVTIRGHGVPDVRFAGRQSQRWFTYTQSGGHTKKRHRPRLTRTPRCQEPQHNAPHPPPRKPAAGSAQGWVLQRTNWLTNADLGVDGTRLGPDRNPVGPVFVAGEGGPYALIIVAIGRHGTEAHEMPDLSAGADR